VTTLLTPQQVAERLNVSLATVYNRIQDGRLPAVQLGPKRYALRVPEDELRAWVYSEEESK
jgi:excisionase family DNA binding protein